MNSGIGWKLIIIMAIILGAASCGTGLRVGSGLTGGGSLIRINSDTRVDNNFEMFTFKSDWR